MANNLISSSTEYRRVTESPGMMFFVFFSFLFYFLFSVLSETKPQPNEGQTRRRKVHRTRQSESG